MHSIIKNLFNGIEDPRVERTKYHPLNTILYIVLCGSFAGINTWTGFADFAEAHQETLKKFIDLDEGIPSHDTISRVISSLNVEQFALCFEKFVKELSQLVKGTIAIDGKTIRGSADNGKNIKPKHIISAWSDATKLVLAQVKVNEKSNEITAIPELLKMLDVQGQIVTIDAMGCQRDICQKIVEKSGDYVICLKGNQGSLHKDVKAFFEDQESEITHEWEEFDKGHGRIEHRICRATDDIEWLQREYEWPGMVSIAAVYSTRETKNGIGKDVRYYISSLQADAERIAKTARSHWGIENKLHWVLDVVFNEDKTKIRNENAPEVLSLMRKWGLNLINMHKDAKMSVARMTKKISMNPKYLVDLLIKI